MNKSWNLMLAIVASVAVIVASVFGGSVINHLLLKNYEYGQFDSPSQRLMVTAAADSGNKRYGAIEIVNGKDDINILLEPAEWAKLTTIWRTARSQHEVNLVKIGGIDDTGVDDITHLTMSAGSSIRITLEENHVCVTYDVVQADYQRFDRSLQQVKLFTAGGDPGQGVNRGSPDISAAIHATILTFTDRWSHRVPKASNCGKT